MALAAYVAAVTVLSEWWSAIGQAGKPAGGGAAGGEGYVVTLSGGTLAAGHLASANRSNLTGWRVVRRTWANADFRWWLNSPGLSANLGPLGIQRINGFGAVGTIVMVVLWPLPPTMAAAGWQLRAWGTRTATRPRRGLCPACAYDLRGLAPGTVCPECGRDGGGSTATAPPAPPAA